MKAKTNAAITIPTIAPTLSLAGFAVKVAPGQRGASPRHPLGKTASVVRQKLVPRLQFVNFNQLDGRGPLSFVPFRYLN
jgi:hypothetical protein